MSCGSRSALDTGEVQGAGPSRSARGGSKSGEPQGTVSSGAGSSSVLAGNGGSGGTSGEANQGGSATGTPLDTPQDLPAAMSGARLKAQFLSTPDGIAQFVGFYDADRNETCQLQLMPDDKVWCIPTAVRVDTQYVQDGRPRFGTGPYAHSDCTDLLYVEPAPDCPGVPRTRYWITHTEQQTAGPTSCLDPDWKIQPIGELFEPDFEGSYYRDENGECYHSSFVPQGRFYELGEPLPHGALVSAHEQNRDMPSRLVVREWVTSDDAHQALGWYDTERREACRFTLTEDDTTRCVPEAQGYGDYYDDAGCHDPVVDISSNLYCRAKPLKYGGRTLGSKSCSFQVETYELGEQVTNGANVLFGGGQCDHVWTSATSDHPFARLGAVVPASSFDALRTVFVGGGRLRQERQANPEGFTLPATLTVPLDPWGAPPRYADSEREEICFFQTTEDGLSRCVPLSFTIDDWKPNEAPRPREYLSMSPSCEPMNQSYLRRHYCAPPGASAPESGYSKSPNAIAETIKPDACTPAHAELWAVTEAHDPAREQIYWQGNPPGSECLAATATELDYVGVVGERIPRTAFQPAVVITEK